MIGERSATAGRARSRRVRTRTPERQHQHRVERSIRDMGRHLAGPRIDPFVIIAPPGREIEAATRLGRIGLDNVAGYLEGGMQALEDRDDLLAYTLQTSCASIRPWVGEPDAPYVLDVRTPSEWQHRHVDGSVNIPLSRLAAQCERHPAQPPGCGDVRRRLPFLDSRKSPTASWVQPIE